MGNRMEKIIWSLELLRAKKRVRKSAAKANVRSTTDTMIVTDDFIQKLNFFVIHLLLNILHFDLK